jgi:hypothetical protein
MSEQQQQQTPSSVKIMQIIDLTEWVEDQLVGWSIEERTRWEGEGGLIPRPAPPLLCGRSNQGPSQHRSGISRG